MNPILSLSSKAGEENELLSSRFLSISFCLSLLQCIIVCREQKWIALFSKWSGYCRSMVDKYFLEGASQPRSHCDFHKQKGLPCLLLQNRLWRAPSLKDIKKEKKKHQCQALALRGFLRFMPIVMKICNKDNKRLCLHPQDSVTLFRAKL